MSETSAGPFPEHVRQEDRRHCVTCGAPVAYYERSSGTPTVIELPNCGPLFRFYKCTTCRPKPAPVLRGPVMVSHAQMRKRIRTRRK